MDAAKPAQMKFCVNSKWLESLIVLQFIMDVTSYGILADGQLRKYFESKAKSSNDVESIDMLDKIVEQSLSTDMTDKDAKSRIETLFMSYKSLLRRQGLS